MPPRKTSRKPSSPKPNAGAHAFARQITLVICIKLAVLFGIWYAFIREHKVPHDTPATTRHILNQPS